LNAIAHQARELHSITVIDQLAHCASFRVTGFPSGSKRSGFHPIATTSGKQM
jgi:hypothetical protein